MEIRILEEKTNRLVFEVDADHTLCNMIKEELLSNDDVKAAGYHVAHPIASKPKFIVETKKGTEAKKSVSEAVKSLRKAISGFSDKAKKELE